MTRPKRAALAGAALSLVLIAGCGDIDMRGQFGNAPSTADAARAATAERPEPDARGVISYPSYQVAVAQRGDTLSALATRIGGDAAAIARFNGLEPGDTLREGEVVALPNRVSEPDGGPLTPGSIDITALAGAAIDEADRPAADASPSMIEPPAQTRRQPQGVSGVEPVRHKVARGETAYSIARLYNVSVRSLADWNGLGADFTVREGRYLLIPVALPGKPQSALDPERTALPGEGTVTPEPPSASTPLPDDETEPASTPRTTTAAPDLSQPATTSTARMGMPVEGSIVRDYEKGKNDGIDISASPGSPVRAADAGTVAAITEDTNGVPIIVVKHAGNLLTVYSNIGNVTVRKGESVRKGAKLAEVRSEGSPAVHFEVREGFDSVDPMPYLQ